MGTAFGPILYFSSLKRQDQPITKSCLWIPIINFSTSVFASIPIFLFLGYVSNRLGIPVEQVATKDESLAFVAYPGLIATTSAPNFWSLMFFIMLFFVGVDTCFTAYEFILAYFIEIIPGFSKLRREVSVAIFLTVSFLFSLILQRQNGYFIFTVFNNFAPVLPLLWVLIWETISVGWVFGLDNLDILLRKRTGETFPRWTMFFIRYLTPFFGSLVFLIAASKQLAKDWTGAPGWAPVLAIILMFFPLIFTFLGFCTRIKSPTFNDLVLDQYGMTME